MQNVELLAPAGNLEKLKIAIAYGADAVYAGGERYGLRAAAGNFSFDDLKEGVKYAHQRGKRVYLTMNIIPHNEDLVGMEEYLLKVNEIGIDAIILSDPGIFSIVKKTLPNMEIHLSTQTNNTNWASANFWYDHGIKRIVLARELSVNEIKEIREKVHEDLEFEAFVHGAMCISYSGRCLLSNYMANRDSNRGECAQPCRWNYKLVEEKRPNEHMPIYEDERGTYIFNSKDLCMIKNLPDLIEAGVKSLKIEGRMKSSYYVATIVKAYREAIDSYLQNPNDYVFDEKLYEEVTKASHRKYTTGFYFNKTTSEDQVYSDSSYIRNYDFVGVVLEYNKETGIAKIEQRNRISVGDEIEIMCPNGKPFIHTVSSMQNDSGENIDIAQHPQMVLYMPIKEEVTEFSMLRRKI